MKKTAIILLLLVFAITGCQKEEEIVPLENIQIDLFSEFYQGYNFTILERTNPEQKAYISIGYSIGENHTVGASHLDNYLVLYEEDYYNLIQGYALGLYDGDDLIQYGIPGISVDCSTEDSCN